MNYLPKINYELSFCDKTIHRNIENFTAGLWKKRALLLCNFWQMLVKMCGMKFLAPAKINLCLHVVDKLNDGYHALESIVVFAKDLGDTITITPAPTFNFSIDGPQGAALGGGDDNLVVKAAKGLAALCDKRLACNIVLTKNLPVASGIGGGSADAAATVRGLFKFWDIESIPNGLSEFLLSLGADVPVCFFNEPAYIGGIGEQIKPLSIPDSLYILLVNEGNPCSTPDVFRRYTPPFSAPMNIPQTWQSAEDFIVFLESCSNDLYVPACTCVPSLQAVVTLIEQQRGCVLARMSGSGATCFGLFTDRSVADEARENILARHSNWWVHVSTISC